MKRPYQLVISYFTKGQPRTVKAKKNIFYSFILKGIDIFTGILIVPLALSYLDATRYGIWLTLSSIIMWFGFFDVGLGHGLRNKLAEAFSEKNDEMATKYISTAYSSLGLISLVLFLLFFIVNNFLNWQVILNTTEIPVNELNSLVLITFGFFFIRLVIQLINNILFADQRPAYKDLITTSGKLLNLVVLYILIKTTKDSLLYLGVSYSAAPVIMLFVFTLILFKKQYRKYKPSFRLFDFRLLKDVVNLGGKFFIIQISSVVLYTTDNMIITQLFSPAEVTPYQIAHRYFGLVLMGFLIIVTPFWSAITEAYIKKDIQWITRSIKKLLQLWLLAVVLIVIMLLLSKYVYYLWVGDKVIIPFILSAAWALFIALQSLNTLLTHFINGIGKIKLQMILALTGAVLNIPLSIFLAKYMGFGITGVIAATIIAQILSLSFCYVQYRKIINFRDYGIWAK
ncbi:MAG: polysaccharide biosynthesis C-terminal domain-containing protein [Candidatus Atribacteria bacterium]|nr:polysaccharide biosynthesis C-terminal domain-containing protein [Candidatus Atribacteria bacterium]